MNYNRQAKITVRNRFSDEQITTSEAQESEGGPKGHLGSLTLMCSDRTQARNKHCPEINSQEASLPDRLSFLKCKCPFLCIGVVD